MSADQWLLPDAISSQADIGRLLRELEGVDDFLQQASIRQPGAQVQLPKTSNLFAAMVADNNLNMLTSADRASLKAFLQAVHQKAPKLHISFSTDPSPLVVQRLTTWLRQNIHHYVLLQIGLNPTIGAGCVVRSTNKVFDLSLRQRFLDKRSVLIEHLRGQPTATQPSSALQPSQKQEQPA